MSFYTDDYISKPRPAVAICIIYFWWLIATPIMRFTFFASIYFEKLLVAGLVFYSLKLSEKKNLNSPIFKLYITFFIWAFICHLASDYGNYVMVNHWGSNYWKLMVFFILICINITDRRDFMQLAIGLAVISFLYQLHSWKDFFGGGSYVYQQGLKRMTGVWSGGGIGAANAWGVIGLLTWPFAIYWFDITHHKRIKTLAFFASLLCIATVLNSGTRGCMVVLFAMIFINYWKKVINIKFIILAMSVAMIGFQILPEEHKQRYLSVFVKSDKPKTRMEKAAEHSGESRIEGMIDGYLLAKKHPIFGTGPGSSGYSRSEVRKMVGEIQVLQLHNLYGQVIAENGFPGGVLFSLLLLSCLSSLRKNSKKNKAALKLENELSEELRFSIASTKLLKNMFFLLFAYGMFGHTLHRYYWPIFFALTIGLGALEKSSLHKSMTRN